MRLRQILVFRGSYTGWITRPYCSTPYSLSDRDDKIGDRSILFWITAGIRLIIEKISLKVSKRRAHYGISSIKLKATLNKVHGRSNFFTLDRGDSNYNTTIRYIIIF